MESQKSIQSDKRVSSRTSGSSQAVRKRQVEKEYFSFLSSDRKTKIRAVRWAPAGRPKAVLQLIHGMVEYIDRYDGFAGFLAERGFLVTGNDHLGHGASVARDEDHGFFGHPDGNRNVIKDIDQLRKLTNRSAAEDIPYFMLGHSMGSFLLSQYITEHGNGLSGAVIMGTGYQPSAVLTAGMAVCRLMALIKGWRARSVLVNNMAFGSYNKEFEPARTPQDWLTRDEKIVDAYLNDPWCSFMFTLNGYYQMFKGMKAAHGKDMTAAIPKDLPVLFVSGACDPVGESGSGVKKVFEIYRKAGIKDVSMRLYEDDRHEILNELDKDRVYADLFRWFTERIK